MGTDNKLWRNRKAKKELARRLQSENPGLEVRPHLTVTPLRFAALHLHQVGTGLPPASCAAYKKEPPSLLKGAISLRVLP
jgi:hypothetical protein